MCCTPRACCSYSLHNKGLIFEAAKDQGQTIAVHLLGIAANACVRVASLGFIMAHRTALNICKLFKDPRTLWVSNVHTPKHVCNCAAWLNGGFWIMRTCKRTDASSFCAGCAAPYALLLAHAAP